MTNKRYSLWIVLILIVFGAVHGEMITAEAQGTAFTYQGRLNDNSGPANGTYDFRFRLAADALANNYVGGNVLTNGVPVSNGLFMVTLDFGGNLFNGSNYWLEVDVRTNGALSYTALSPLQAMKPVPYAIMANSASNLLGVLPTTQLSGTLGNQTLPASATFAGSITAGTFSGDGTAVTNVNASALNGLKATNFWQLGGNNVASGQFLGTTNLQNFELRVNNQRALSINTNRADSANFVGGSPANLIDPGVEGGVIAGGGTTNTSSYIQYYFFDSSSSNHLSGDFGFIGSGSGNWAQGDHPIIVGGVNNNIQNGTYECFIGGGVSNTIQQGLYYGTEQDVIGGGYGNTLQGDSYDSIIACGQGNTIGIYNWASTISGGYGCSIYNGSYSALGGGYGNIISNQYATIPGGQSNLATGLYSLAAGQRAKALHNGTFVWADSQSSDFGSMTNDEFNIRAQNGVRIQADKGIHLNSADEPLIVRDWDVFSTNAPASKAGIGRWGLFMEPSILTIGIPSNDVSPRYFQVAKYSTNGNTTTLMLVDQSGLVSATGGMRANDKPIYLRGAADVNHGLAYNGNTVTNFGGGSYQVDGPVLFGWNGGLLGTKNGSDHVALLWTTTSVTVNGTFNNNSDRNAKQDFAAVTPAEILNKVTRLPLSEWSYKADATTRHIGPMAQDFYSAFNVGTDDKHIAPIDEGGVALAAIQGLNQKLNDKDAEIQKLEAQNDLLTKRLAELEATVRAISMEK